MSYKDIMRVIPTIQSAKLVEHNMKKATKKSSTKDIVGLGVDNIVGVNLIKVQSDLIEGL